MLSLIHIYRCAGGKAALFNGQHPVPAAGAPVVAHGGLQGIAHAVQKGQHKAVHIHQDAVDRYGVGSSQAQQHHVHDDGGHPSGNVAQKGGAAAAEDAAHDVPGEPGPAEPQGHPSGQKGSHGQHLSLIPIFCICSV